MSVLSRYIPVLVLCAAVILFAGCSSFQIVNERALTVDDIVKMSRAGVGKDVIIRDIEVTYSRFKLDPDEIVRLTEAGVDDEVIEVMIESGAVQGPYDWEYMAWPYDNWVNYYDYYGYYYGYRYHYPYYPTYMPYMYMSPYVVYREPGLVGRFYRYVPIGGRYRPYYDYYSKRRREKKDDSGGKEER